MLPLWIIDITGKSDRRDAFQHLVGQIKHVYIPDEIKNSLLETTNTSEESSDSTQDSGNENDTNNESVQKFNSEESIGILKRTLEEELEEESKKEAAKNAVVSGDYWYYSVFDNPFEDELDEERTNEVEAFIQERNDEREQEGLDPLTQEEIDTYVHALKLYNFQEKMVREGVAFIDRLRRSNVKPYQAVNIVVLGDSTEKFTRTVFPSIAALLQKEKGRYWTSHIHQGMTIWGALYVPCDVNTFKVDQRKEILHMLDEIEVQHNITAIRGYDHMMLYQNVQNRTECTYSLLEPEQQAEYLVQCLVHMFLASNINHPTISGTASEDTFYFSMGAASVYFDMHVEDANDANEVAKNIIDNFKEDCESEDARDFEPLLEKDVYHAEMFVKEFNKIEDMELDNIGIKAFSPHPILDYLHKSLKRLYYQVQLRYFPASLLRSILTVIEEKTSNMLDRISATSTSAYKSAAMAIHPAIVRRISKVTEGEGGLSHIENLIRNMRELMSKERERIPIVLEHEFWDRIIYKSAIIPKNQRDFFIEYHDIYKADVASKNDGAGCTNTRQEVLAKLKALLSKEKTTLATLCRVFFMGIMCVLFFLPFLDFLSPNTIDLGNVKENSFYWGIVVFMIPAFIQWIAFLLYLRKRNALIRVLKAYYTHDAYARVANRIGAESNEVYLKLMELGEEYLKRCKRIRKEIKFVSPLPEAQMAFPRSMFNQPLNGGTFNREVIIPASEIECSRIRVNYEPRPVSDLKRPEYFMLINYFNDIIGSLFGGVEIVENHARRYNNELEDYEFVSREELLKEKEEEWVRNRFNFRESLLKGIADEMLPREYPTVGDKLIQYRRKIDKFTLLEPLMTFAATNGEITSDSDMEYADIKVNREVDDLSSPYLPIYTTRTQVGKYDEIYRKYIFVTRWRCFDHFSYNRILPVEDFDMDERAVVNFVEEKKVRRKKQIERERQSKGQEYAADVESKIQPYVPCHSSLILWAVCPDENSSEWLNLIDSNHFGRAYQDREKYREVLNQND